MKNRYPFPQKPVSKIKFLFLFNKILKKLSISSNYNHGVPITKPNKTAIKIWELLLPYNPNNIGNWSSSIKRHYHQTGVIERELINQMIDLYKGNLSSLEGYVTSGGTESNIFCSWLGRKYIEEKGIKKEKICLLKTSLTHYSVVKAADVAGIPSLAVPINENTWSMDVKFLRKKIAILYKKGYRGFLFPLTLGYTLTGTHDPYEKICEEISKIKSDFKKLETFIWIDAAINGLVEPFINNNFSPFSINEIQAILTDFHKLGFVPYSAGVLIYRRKLRKLIERDIDYLPIRDNTLLGSRSGIPAVACWAVIQKLGKEGFLKNIKNSQKRRKNFINEYKSYQGIKLISNPKSISLGILTKNKKHQNSLERKFGIHFNNIKIDFTDQKRLVSIGKMFFTSD